MTDIIEMDDDYLTQLADGQGIGVPEEHIEAFFMFARAAARAQRRLDLAVTPPLDKCSEVIRDEILKDSALAMGIARGLWSLAKEHLVDHSEPEQKNELAGSRLERALSLEIMNCAVNDRDEITWANVRCRGTRTNLFPNASKVQFTERQIRSAWHAFATRNDLDTIVLRSVTEFILELTQ